MHRCKDNIGCLSVEVFNIVHDVEASCFKIGIDANADAFRIGVRMNITCFHICSINKDKPYWMWNAGEILCWDNNEYIAL